VVPLMGLDALVFLQQYGGAIALLASVAVLLLASKFVTRESFGKDIGAIEGRVKVLETKADRTEDRVTVIEKDIEHLPDRDATHRMELALSELKGQLAQLDERLKPVSNTASRLQEYLLERGK
jgi:chromosome segregation ATPase